MEREKLQELMIEYIDGNLHGELKKTVEGQIKKDESIARKYQELKSAMELIDSDRVFEPDKSLSKEFEKMLEDEMSEGKEIELKPRFRWNVSPMQAVAAITLLVSGVFLGTYINQSQSNKGDIADLKREVEMTKQLLIQSMENKTSAGSRLKGVNATYTIAHADKDIVNVLVRAMNTDENTNVRLAAVRALAHFSDEPKIRQVLISALETQADAMVQIELINLMVQWKEKSVVNKLKELIEDEETKETVKDEAHMAVFKLS